jgi:hypothetical protein
MTRWLATSKQKRKMKEKGILKKRGERASNKASQQQEHLTRQEKVAKEGVWDWREIFFLGLFPLLLAGALVVIFPDFKDLVFEANYEPLEDVKTRPLKLPFGGSGSRGGDDNEKTDDENANASEPE